MALDQSNRMLQLTTPLGENELLLTAFRGREEISDLFQFDLEMLSDNSAIAATDIVGKNVTFKLKLADDSIKHFNGFVARFAAGDEDDQGRRNYRAQVVPWLWFLTQRTNCRIFQQESVPDIIEKIFSDLGFSDYKLQLSGSHPSRDYCVQYRESDYQFIARLAKEEGIFFFFEHEDGKHTLVLGDDSGAYADCDETSVDYPRDYGSRAVADHITSWEHRYEFHTGKWAQTDYNFETPSTNLMTNSSTVVPVSDVDKYEKYDYPGVYGNTGDGRALTDLRMEEEEVQYDVVEGTSLCKSFFSGGKFSINHHRSSAEEGKSYVLVSVAHEAVEPAAYETGASVDRDYHNSFTCIPDSVSFRPYREVPRPFVQGVQTAIVVGPSGEEIYPDKYGRVIVQFHWDRDGKSDEHSSCWIRVAQVHAGKGFGGIDIPRIGEEVIVDFLEGDPDRPIITGRVYHSENMPPFGLPDKKTISGMKSKTYKGDGYNEFILDDTPGDELIRVHGQYDMDSTIENDLREHVLNNRSRDVAVDETVSVGSNQSISIGSNRTIDVGANHAETIGSNMTIGIGSNLSETVGINYSETVGAAMELTVGAVMTQTIGATFALSVGGSMSESVGSNRTASVGGSRKEQVSGKVTEKVGGDVAQQYGGKHTEKTSGNVTVKSGASMTLQAADQIVLKAGGASITLKKSGDITIKGTKITVNGSAKIVEKSAVISSEAQAKNLVKGAMVNVEASAVNTIKGALVKIN